jgi:hypothetical protein
VDDQGCARGNIYVGDTSIGRVAKITRPKSGFRRYRLKRKQPPWISPRRLF